MNPIQNNTTHTEATPKVMPANAKKEIEEWDYEDRDVLIEADAWKLNVVSYNTYPIGMTNYRPYGIN
jgi:hypothetical protein